MTRSLTDPVLNTRVFLFSLAAACLAVAGCQPLPGAAPNNNFHLTVERVITNSDMLVSLVKVEVKIKAQQDVHLSITSLANVESSLSVLIAGGSNGEAGSGQVAFSASRFSRSGDEYAQVQLYEQAQSGGNSAGGPSWRRIPSATQLADYFSISAADGDYPMDTPMKIGDLDGKPVMLTVVKMQ
jgi:hypothetical protein